MPISIGTDPGSSNYGYSIAEFSIKKEKLCFDLLEIGMFISTLTNLTTKELKPPKSKRRKRTPMVMEQPFVIQFDDFLNEWNSIIKEFSPSKVSSERFQPRGRGGGKTIELVNMMNGSVATLARSHGADYECFTAATWKNEVNKIITLDELYKTLHIPPHIVDAVLINVHGILNKHGLRWTSVDFKNLTKQLTHYIFEK